MSVSLFVIKWLPNLLKGRAVQVLIHNHLSYLAYVPQGAATSMLLSQKTRHNSLKICHIPRLYTGDTAYWVFTHQHRLLISRIQQVLQTFITFCIAWRIAGKTQLCLFYLNKRHKHNFLATPVCIGYISVFPQHRYKYLAIR